MRHAHYILHSVAQQRIREARAEGREDWKIAVALAFFAGAFVGILLGSIQP